jgi:hypothetical protein
MSQRHNIDYRLMQLLRELDRRSCFEGGRPFRVGSWLADNFGLGYGAAREKVRTARALGDLPLIDAAFRDGRLSYSKVRALTRVANAGNEAELLQTTERCSAEAVEHVVRRMKQRERLDDVQEMLRQRSLTYAWDEDGSLVVRARLTPEQGAVWLKALERAEERLSSTSNNESSEAADKKDFDVLHADAMTLALEESLRGTSENGRSGDRYQVMVHVPAGTLAAPSEDASAGDYPPAIADNGPLLHPETVRRLTCDGTLVSVIEDDAGQVLNVGRKTRTIPPAIRRALFARDVHCQFPGCAQTRHLDGHHLVHWAHGGETSLENLILLCRRHHRQVHEFGHTFPRERDSGQPCSEANPLPSATSFSSSGAGFHASPP